MGGMRSILVAVEVYSSFFVSVFEPDGKIGFLGDFFFGFGRRWYLLGRRHVCVLGGWDEGLLFSVMMGRLRVMMMLMVCRRGGLLMVSLFVYYWWSWGNFFGFDWLFCLFLIEKTQFFSAFLNIHCWDISFDLI